MATRSAEKAHRQSQVRRMRNRAVKSATKTAVKKANEAIVSGDLDAAREMTRAAIVALDKAAQKGVLHPNNSARHKSRLLIKYNAAVAVRQVSGAEGEAQASADKPAKKAEAKATRKRSAPAKKTSKK